jgi:hypothetical protein
MNKYLIAILPLLSAALADDGYAAPAATYGAPAPAAPAAYAAPDTGYGAPDTGYGAPDTGYGAPDAGYGAPDAGYGPPATGYGGAVVEEEGTDLGATIGDLLPLFLAVFAAIIVAQLFAPLLGLIFNAKVGLLGGIFAPFGSLKIGIINQILAPFNLVLANFPAGGTAAAGPLTVAGGRSLSRGFNANPETVDLVTNMLYSAIKNYSS